MGAVGDDFYVAMLASLGAPATPNTLQLCRDWQRFEGGSAAWNPWNTTQWAQGATEYNGAGVKDYPDEATGISATVSTLRNGYYPSVVHAFAVDLPGHEWGLSAAIVDQINIWGTHGFAAYLRGIATPPLPPPAAKQEDDVDYVIIATQDAQGQSEGAYLVHAPSGAASGIVADNAPTVPHVTMTADGYNTFVGQLQVHAAKGGA